MGREAESGKLPLYCIFVMDFINSRYAKRLPLDNFAVSRTANFYSSLVRKESAQTDIYKTAQKVLPRL